MGAFSSGLLRLGWPHALSGLTVGGQHTQQVGGSQSPISVAAIQATRISGAISTAAIQATRVGGTDAALAAIEAQIATIAQQISALANVVNLLVAEVSAVDQQLGR